MNDPLFGCRGAYTADLPTIFKGTVTIPSDLTTSSSLLLYFPTASYQVSGCVAFASSTPNLIKSPVKCLGSTDGTDYVLTITSPSYTVASGSQLTIWFSESTNADLSKKKSIYLIQLCKFFY